MAKNIDSVKLRRFVKLTKDKKKHEAALDKIKKELEGLNETLLTQFAQTGTQRTTVDGMTVYLGKRTWASYPQGRGEAIKALREAGLDDYVKEDFNHQSLSSYVASATKDDDPDAEGLPEEFKGRIEASDVYTIKAVQA